MGSNQFSYPLPVYSHCHFGDQMGGGLHLHFDYRIIGKNLTKNILPAQLPVNLVVYLLLQHHLLLPQSRWENNTLQILLVQLPRYVRSKRLARSEAAKKYLRYFRSPFFFGFFTGSLAFAPQYQWPIKRRNNHSQSNSIALFAILKKAY